MSKVKMVAGLVVILFCLLGSVGYAQGELTLEGLAERVEALIKRVSISDTRLSQLETRVATLESSLLSAEAEETPTPIAMKTGKATATATSARKWKPVKTGDVRWTILSAEYLGDRIEFDGRYEVTEGGFIQVRLKIETLETRSSSHFSGQSIEDGQGQRYYAWRKRKEYIPARERCIDDPPLAQGTWILSNTSVICTVIYEVGRDSSDFVFLADDLTTMYVKRIDLGLSRELIRATATAMAAEKKTATAVVFVRRTATAISIHTATAVAEATLASIRTATASARETSAAVSRNATATIVALTPTATFTPRPTATPRPVFRSFFPGTYRVGIDIDPGLYRGDGRCYWARLSDLSGTVAGIIANEITNGQFFVEVKPSDYAVEFTCSVQRVE